MIFTGEEVLVREVHFNHGTPVYWEGLQELWPLTDGLWVLDDDADGAVLSAVSQLDSITADTYT